MTAHASKPGFPRPAGRGLLPDLWLFGEGPRRTFAGDVGDVADLAGNTPAGVRGGNAAWAPGPMGPCLSFAPPSEVAFTFLCTLPLTVSCWFNLSALSNYAAILMTRDSGLCMMGLTATPGNPLCGVWDDAGYDDPTGLAVAAGRWYFGAVRFTPSAITTFLGDPSDGSFRRFDRPGTYAARQSTVQSWRVGNDPGYAPMPAGFVDLLAIHRRAVPAWELARDFAGPLWRLGRGRRRRDFAGRLDAATAGPAFRPYFLRSTAVVGGGVLR